MRSVPAATSLSNGVISVPHCQRAAAWCSIYNISHLWPGCQYSIHKVCGHFFVIVWCNSSLALQCLMPALDCIFEDLGERLVLSIRHIDHHLLDVHEGAQANYLGA